MPRPLAMVLAFVVGLLLRGHHDATIGHDAFNSLESGQQGELAANSERRTSINPRVSTPRADERSTADGDPDDLFLGLALALDLRDPGIGVLFERPSASDRHSRMRGDAQPRGPPTA